MGSDNNSHEVIVCLLLLVVFCLGVVANRSESFGMTAPGTLSARLRGATGQPPVLAARLREAGAIAGIGGGPLKAQINTLEHFGGATPGGTSSSMSARLSDASSKVLGNLGKENYAPTLDLNSIKNAITHDNKHQVMKGFLVK